MSKTENEQEEWLLIQLTHKHAHAIKDLNMKTDSRGCFRTLN